MKTCAICIAAYDCVEFLPDLLQSINSQISVNGWNYDFRIGVDGCMKTYGYLRSSGIPFYFSENNVGHLIMRNSLMYVKPANAYAYFDADDFMYPDYLSENILALEKHKFVMAKKINVNEKLQNARNNKPVIENGGAMTFAHEVIEKIGGFPPYRCGGDTDFMRRAEMAGFYIHTIDEALYLRRAHNKCLTRAPETKIASDYRKKAWEEMTKQREKGIFFIEPVKTELKFIDNQN